MKNNLLTTIIVVALLALIFASCAGSRQSPHNHGVNNHSYIGYWFLNSLRSHALRHEASAKSALRLPNPMRWDLSSPSAWLYLTIRQVSVLIQGNPVPRFKQEGGFLEQVLLPGHTSLKYLLTPKHQNAR